jgi:hypothetical protein
MSREWFVFFQNLNTLLGNGTNNTSLLDILIGPSVNAYVDVDAASVSLDPLMPVVMFETDDLAPPQQIVLPPDDLSPPLELGTIAAQNAENVNITGGTVVLNGGATLMGTNAALTNGAGVAAGTLLTAPAAGNPTKWIGINDNGTTRYIPAW